MRGQIILPVDAVVTLVQTVKSCSRELKDHTRLDENTGWTVRNQTWKTITDQLNVRYRRELNLEQYMKKFLNVKTMTKWKLDNEAKRRRQPGSENFCIRFTAPEREYLRLFLGIIRDELPPLTPKKHKKMAEVKNETSSTMNGTPDGNGSVGSCEIINDDEDDDVEPMNASSINWEDELAHITAEASRNCGCIESRNSPNNIDDTVADSILGRIPGISPLLTGDRAHRPLRATTSTQSAHESVHSKFTLASELPCRRSSPAGPAAATANFDLSLSEMNAVELKAMLFPNGKGDARTKNAREQENEMNAAESIHQIGEKQKHFLTFEASELTDENHEHHRVNGNQFHLVDLDLINDGLNNGNACGGGGAERNSVGNNNRGGNSRNHHHHTIFNINSADDNSNDQQQETEVGRLKRLKCELIEMQKLELMRREKWRLKKEFMLGRQTVALENIVLLLRGIHDSNKK